MAYMFRYLLYRKEYMSGYHKNYVYANILLYSIFTLLILLVAMRNKKPSSALLTHIVLKTITLNGWNDIGNSRTYLLLLYTCVFSVLDVERAFSATQANFLLKTNELVHEKRHFLINKSYAAFIIAHHAWKEGVFSRERGSVCVPIWQKRLRMEIPHQSG